MKFSKIVFAKSIPAFSYEIPIHISSKIEIGKFVVAPLQNKNQIGVVTDISDTIDFVGKTKPIVSIIDEIHISPLLISLWKKVASYYLTPLGDIVNASIPSSLLQNKNIETLLNKPEKKIKWFSEKKKTKATIHQELEKITLSPSQKGVFDDIIKNIDSNKPILLHGITGSGKTHVYMATIEYMLSKNPNQTILVLLPEINITYQILKKFKKIFGDDTVYSFHSKTVKSEKDRLYKSFILDKSPKSKIIIGARSAIFLPFDMLDFIIIDEEHDHSYKQEDPSPRYHTRDVALFYTKIFGSKLLLGSATPSVESFYNAANNDFCHLSLTNRHSDFELPKISLVNMHKDKSKEYPIFSETMLEHISHALSQKNQVILFYNRRGYATTIICESCLQSIKCPNCAVQLVYHNANNSLRCHYCHYKQTYSTNCQSCNKVDSLQKLNGIGIQQIESWLNTIYPDTKVLRMDSDSTRKKNTLENIVTEIEKEEPLILLGTQMIAKGFDFKKISLVGILDADALIDYPDFRAKEKAFQTLTQVSGRGGRHMANTNVIIQTYIENEPLYMQVQEHDYMAMYYQQLEERKSFDYPPFSRVVQIGFSSIDIKKLQNAAEYFKSLLENNYTGYFAGPQTPLIAKINQRHLVQFWLKLPIDKTIFINQKRELENIIDFYHKHFRSSSVKIKINIDC